VGEAARAEDTGFLWRSDFRVGECNEARDAFFVTAGVDLVLDSAVEPDTGREAACRPADLDAPFVCVPLGVLRGVFFAGSGGGGSRLTRDDLRTPLSKMVVGPSAANVFHGGETARDAEGRGVVSSSLRRFEGGSRPALSSCGAGGCTSAFIDSALLSSGGWLGWAARGSWWTLAGSDGA
jgi:hypothetical protein